MLFTFVVAATASQALGLRPKMASSARSAQFARILEFTKVDLSDPSKSGTVLQEVGDVVNSMVQGGNATDHLTAADIELLEDAIVVIKENMYGSMRVQETGDKQGLKDAIDKINQCYMDLSGRVDGDLQSMLNGVNNYQIKLDVLQDDVDAKTILNNSAWETLQTHISMIGAAPECPAFPSPRTMQALDVYFSESPYSTWWIAQKEAYEPVRDAWWAAHLALQQALTAYAVGLAVRDVAYCDWKRELEWACAQYSACYEAAKAHYLNEVKPQVDENMKNRIENYKAGETIVHNIKFLLALVPDQEVGPIATDSWVLAFPEVPAKRECDMSALHDPKWVPTPQCGTSVPTCAEQAGRLSDLQSEAHMHAAGWEFNGGFTDRTFGETFEGWASQLAVGRLETTLRGEGRIALDLKETHGIDNGESYLKVFLNNDEIDKIGSGTRKTVVVSYKDGDLLSIQESYGKITLSSVTCRQERRAACEWKNHHLHRECHMINKGICFGRVKYGFGDTWTEWRDMAGEFQCSNEVFGDPFKFQGKECICDEEVPKCALNQPVFIVGHRDQALADHHGNVMMHSNRLDSETWTLSAAEDGGVFITSHQNLQLQDHSNNLRLHPNKSNEETWILSPGGEGRVFIASHRDRHLSDHDGTVQLHPNKHMWERWNIITADGQQACH